MNLAESQHEYTKYVTRKGDIVKVRNDIGELTDQQKYKLTSLTGPFEKHKMFFVHIPKNAGTTVMKTIMGNMEGAVSHETADQINSIDAYKDYKNFIFCRDPMSRFVSAYLWRLRKDKLVQRLTIENLIEGLDTSSINQPLDDWGWEKNEYKLDRMFNPQSTWINDNTVFVGRVETMRESIRELISKYDLEPIRHSDYFRHNPAKPYGPQPEPTRQKIIKILSDSKHLQNKFFDHYKDDYENFNYEKPKELR